MQSQIPPSYKDQKWNLREAIIWLELYDQPIRRGIISPMTPLIDAFLIVGLAAGFYAWYPSFGGRTQKKKFYISKNYNRHKFQNSPLFKMSPDSSEWLPFFRRTLRHRRDSQPAEPLTVVKPDFEAFQASSDLQVIWLGHSTVLARIGGQTVLFDPVFSKRASPFQWMGPKRFTTTLRLTIEELPPIDAVVISHDHYDHLDYHSIKRLKDKAKHFFVPLGVGGHLNRWGIATDSVTELDWWQETTHGGLTFACTPAQHFSGRALHDRNATLWSSWVVRGDTQRIFFSGDGGYSAQFKQIGETYGPFDVTLLECGQYDPLWAKIHMTPEETVQAHLDLRGKVMLPIHWGAFKLAPHAWTSPVERVLAAATEAKSVVLFPWLGERVRLPYKAAEEQLRSPWWQ